MKYAALIPCAGLGAAWLARPESMPAVLPCYFKLATGLPCPFCGMTRAVCALAKGEAHRALQFHLLSPIVLAALVLWLAVELLALSGRTGPRAWLFSPRAHSVYYAVGALVIGHGVLRMCGIIGSLSL